MKYLNYLLFSLIIIFFAPVLGLIHAAVQKYGDKVVDEEKLSLYSFGALVKYMDPGSLVQFDEREDYILGYCGVLAFAILITFISIIIIRRMLNKDVEVVDKLAYTPSDFCVVGTCP